MDHGPAAPPVAPRATHRSARSAAGFRAPASWPLILVLVLQAVLSARLIGADTAFQDEALYLWAGHLEWAGLLHGAPVPPFPSFFSGAPVIYPPLAALADSVGGLTGARVLSLLFMLGATALGYFTARRLAGPWAAFFAAALFAVAGPTLHLGSFATYDAMALFLVALAAWLVVRAGDRADATLWMAGAGVVLALANLTLYPSALFDPVVVLLALLVALPTPGGRTAAGRALTLLAIVAVLVTGALLLGGSRYLHGVEITTVARVADQDSPTSVLGSAWAWTAVIVVVAACGAVAAWVSRPGSVRAWLMTLLVAAALLVPAEQTLLHSTDSLNKHVDLGVWFAAIAAGYAGERFITAAPAGRLRLITGAACAVALCFPAAVGATQSRGFATAWPNAKAFVGILRPLADGTSGRLLVEDPSIAEYYLPSGTQWERWSSTRNIVLPGGNPTGGPSDRAGIVGPGNAGTYAVYVKGHYWALIALNFNDTSGLDKAIAADVKQNKGYKVVDVVPYGVGPEGTTPGTYIIWRYEPRK
ncbi:MAG: glycosyltransferase family 39 protein [Actinobacteria bacterium]|nr:glycosyltransferase family 39 protein [Actinomycetota bacterium]